jgi:hypothetical protein
MATLSTPISLSPDSQDRVVIFLKNCLQNPAGISQLRATMIEQDLAYYREKDKTEQTQRTQAANRNGDASQMVNPTVPVVAPQVETGLAYLTEIFLSGYPMFPVVAKPEMIDAALQLETVFGESSIHFQWVQHLAKSLRDGLKYNLMAIECDWQRDKVFTLANSPQKEMIYGVPTETIFEGSKIKHLDVYNLILDTQVAPVDIHKKGDYAGYVELLSRIQLKQLFMDLDTNLTMNATAAFESRSGVVTAGQEGVSGTYYIPSINPRAALVAPASGTDWMTWAKLDTEKKIQYSDMYEVATLYARIIPREMGIAGKSGGVPQIYKFIIVNHLVVIFSQRMTNAHNYLPIIVGQPIDDGLAYQTKSFSDQAAPFQALSSALYRSAIQSQRRKVYDRMFYDPSRINKADIDRVDPVARIPIKTEAYGKPISEAISVVPYRDEGVGTILGIAREITEMGNMANGSNRAQQGQFQKGNRTRYEFDEVMQNSDARPRMMAVLLETAFFQPIKHILKSNLLQYQPPATLYNRQQKKEVEIDPVTLRQLTWEFQMADGVLPADKLVNMQLFGQAFQFFAAVPQAAAEWDLAGMFMYQLKLQGARWVDDFKRTPDQQQQFLTTTQTLNGKSSSPTTQPPAVTG